MAGMPRSVVITGAADGIGRGIASHFAQMGDRVALLDYNADKLSSTAKELAHGGATLLPIPCDVRVADEVESAIAQAAAAHGGVDVAINDAAVYPNHAVVDMTEEEWDWVLDTNLKGAFLFTRAAARAMIDQARGGKLCLIASGAYRSARRGAAAYCASKAGLVLLAQTLALELAEHRINVNVVSPGFIEVGLRPGVSIPYRDKIIQDVPVGHFGEPADIAHAVAYLCSKEADFVTGSVLTVDGGSGAGRFHLPYSTTE
jgi:NAD(P)-dependent dehydrogenase (short-subunit alcohol dehydrogenase family)